MSKNSQEKMVTQHLVPPLAQTSDDRTVQLFARSADNVVLLVSVVVNAIYIYCRLFVMHAVFKSSFHLCILRRTAYFVYSVRESFQLRNLN